jgi:hypothetical protein
MSRPPAAAAASGLSGFPVTRTGRRQVIDLPQGIRARVTEHRIVSRRCACGAVTSGRPPAGVSAPVQYGPQAVAVCAYLWHGRFLSRSRTCEAVRELFAVPVSPGAVAGIVSRIAGALGGTLEAIRKALISADVAHFDETGFRVAGQARLGALGILGQVHADHRAPQARPGSHGHRRGAAVLHRDRGA